jgi:small-conductance mechanosensitive channel/CRP-like cAMP-binding protein
VNLLENLLNEALADRTFALGAALVVTLAVTRALVPKDQRRTSGTVLLYLCHLALVPVAGYLRMATGADATHLAPGTQAAVESGLYGDVRLALLILGAMTAIGLAGQLVFEVLLPRVRLPAPRILRDLSTAAASIIAVFAIASRLGFNLSGIIATSAVVTAVIGFSLQDTLGNIMGGMALQLDNSISVGDWVKVGDVSGRVTEIRWRYTAVETRNWETVIFPNSILMKGQVTVLGRRIGQPQYWRRWIYFNVGFDHSPTEIMEAVRTALTYAPIERVAGEPPPQCILMDLNDSGCRYAVRYWLTDIAADDPTDSAVRARIYFALKRLSIPFSLPSHQIYLHDDAHNQLDEKQVREQEHRLRILEKVDLFRDLAPEERDRIATALKYAPFGRGETLTKQGNVAHWLYIIVSGEVGVRVSVEDGGDREVSRLQGPAFVGEMGLLTGDPRTATIVAVTDVECYRLDKTAFQTILQERPELAGTVAEVLTRRKVELEAVREGLSAEAKERRVRESSAQVLGRIRDFFGL